MRYLLLLEEGLAAKRQSRYEKDGEAMSYTDGMPYDAVFEPVEGQVNLEMHPKFQNQTVNVGSQRLAIPGGVSRIMITWKYPGQHVRVQWGAIEEGTTATVNTWSGDLLLIAKAGEDPAMKQITIPTVHGALIRVMMVGGNPSPETLAAKPVLGLEVYPSLNSAVAPE